MFDKSFFIYFSPVRSNTSKIVIAIDGFSSCGKSTLAKDLARHLNYKYVDSGAMYRAVCLYCLEHDIDIHDHNAVIQVLDHIQIDFYSSNGFNRTLLNNMDVENEIRTLRVSAMVSEIAVIPEVRKKLVDIQKKLGKNKGIVMDGRDITTVVFPLAELKLFLTADIDTRVERRYSELKLKGKLNTIQEVRENLLHRDHIDTTREHSPLTKSEDAFLVDNTHLNINEQLYVVLFFMDFVCKT